MKDIQCKNNIKARQWLEEKSVGVCIKFHGNPFNTCLDILDWIKVVDRPQDTAIHKAMLLARLRTKQA